MRNRAAAIVIQDNKLLVIQRNNKGAEYYTFPGGGIEVGETSEQATVREVDEETSITITIDRLVYQLDHDNGDTHYYYLCEYVSGTPSLRQDSSEYADNLKGDNTYNPMWLDIDKINGITLYPEEATREFLKNLTEGFPEQPVIIPAITH